MHHSFASIILAVLFSSCAASLTYSTDYPLTEETFRTRDGMLSGRIPVGWFSSTEDSIAPALTAWLIKEDFSATLMMKELKLDALSTEQVKKQGLKLLAYLASGLEEEHSSGEAIEPKEFEMHGRKFCSYETRVGENRKRSVVFAARGKFYDCEASVAKGRWSDEEIKKMFTAQQTLLSSLSEAEKP